MSENENPSKINVIRDIFTNLPEEIKNFKRIPCAMSSVYTGIIGGALTATISLISTGKLSSLRFGVMGYLGSSIASWHWCRKELKK